VGQGKRIAPISVPGVRTDLQWADQNAIGALAAERKVAGAGTIHDRRTQHGEDCGALLREHWAASSHQFCCDGGSAIVAFARKEGIPHHVLPAPGAPDFHLNTMNSYHSRLKEWMRRFHGVATKNLPNSLGWRRALEALGGRVKPEDWILGAAGMGPYQQVTP